MHFKNVSLSKEEVLLMEKLLELVNTNVVLSHRLGLLKVLRGISLRIAKGETLAIIGESGCGKSFLGLTLLKLVPAYQVRVIGKIWFKGRNLLEVSEQEMRMIRREKMSYVPQNPAAAFDPTLTVGQQIREIYANNVKNKIFKLLARVGIEDPAWLWKQFPHQLSNGMLQRLMIAMAVYHKPDLIIADEPTAALDVTIRAQVISLFKQLWEETKFAGLFITHDLKVATNLCRRVAVMYAGEIVETGLIDEVFANPLHPYTRHLIECTRALSNPGKDELPYLPGEPPLLNVEQEGCAFAPRCPQAIGKCQIDKPKWNNRASGHAFYCLGDCS